MDKPKWEPINDKKILKNGLTLKEMAEWPIQNYKYHQEIFDKKSDKGEK